jgi:hypothetical protein
MFVLLGDHIKAGRHPLTRNQFRDTRLDYRCRRTRYCNPPITLDCILICIGSSTGQAMVTHYYVYLPPVTLAPFPIPRASAQTRLQFINLSAPVRETGWSLSQSLPRRDDEILARVAGFIAHQHVTDSDKSLVQDAKPTSAGPSTRKRTRSDAASLEAQAHHPQSRWQQTGSRVGEQVEVSGKVKGKGRSQGDEDSSQERSRRRSHRLASGTFPCLLPHAGPG